MKPNLIHGDCIEVLKTFEDNSIDSVVCDPPYGLNFMGKEWDRLGDNSANFYKLGQASRFPNGPAQQKWHYEWAIEVLRVLKPGGYLLAFGGTRTYHRMASGIEDAGFEIRDQLGWMYGSGFPKSHDVSKGIDKRAGAQREVVGTKKGKGGDNLNKLSRPNGNDDADAKGCAAYGVGAKNVDIDIPITAPATDAAKQWQGWGTALKPAWEPIVLARKPLGEKTVAANVLEHGTGALNIDGCRIETKENLNGGAYASSGGRCAGVFGEREGAACGMFQAGKTAEKSFEQPKGRWPANIIHDGSNEVLAAFPDRKTTWVGEDHANNRTGKFLGQLKHPGAQGFNDDGSAARFFYCAKASRKERDEGLDSMDKIRCGGMSATADGSMLTGSGNERLTKRANHHPTVKPIALMAYLCRLVTPPNGLVLDPFMGSGSTGLGALNESFQFIGIEREEEYFKIAQARFDARGLDITDFI